MSTTDTFPASPAPNRAQVSQASTLIGAGLAGGVSVERLAMKTNQHTPGPWIARRNSAFWEVGAEVDGQYDPGIGDVCATDPGNPDSGKQEANARLIAAAPELLAALRGLRAVVHDYMTHADQHAAGEYITSADAAIAKAEGVDHV